jgi:preprotein translocase subunit SecG
MAAAFGGGSSQTAFGARGGATLLSKITAAFAVLFMLGALCLAILGRRGPSSVVGGTPGPPPAPAPVSAPPAPGAAKPSATPPTPATPQQPPAPPAGATTPAQPPAAPPAK